MSVLRQLLPSVIVLTGGLLATPVGMCPVQHVTDEVSYHRDERVERVRAFFAERHSPVEKHARDFVVAADRNHLDWRLLPSISLIESSGGKRYINNNIFGWDSCEKKFSSVREGIHYVAERLSESKLYKDKNVREKLRIYNPYPSYAVRVQRVMDRLGPADLTAGD